MRGRQKPDFDHVFPVDINRQVARQILGANRQNVGENEVAPLAPLEAPERHAATATSQIQSTSGRMKAAIVPISAACELKLVEFDGAQVITRAARG